MHKTILITGANGNLGSKVVSTLHNYGHTLIAVLGPGDVPEKFSEFTASKKLVNLLDEGEAQAYVQRMIIDYPDLDAAILLVGGFAMGSIDTTDESAIDHQISLNFKSAWFLVKPLFKHFKKKNGGQFILIGARPALNLSDGKDMVAYALSKSLVINLAKIINADGAKYGIRASVIVPSIIDTPQNRESMPDANFADWVKPADIAEAMQFILSEPGKNLKGPVFKMYNEA